MCRYYNIRMKYDVKKTNWRIHARAAIVVRQVAVIRKGIFISRPRASRQGFDEHSNLCLVEDHDFPSKHRAHLIMRQVQKGTTEEYRRIGLDVPRPDLLANADLYELIKDETPNKNKNNKLVTRKNLDGPCADDIQCVIARIAMQILCGIAALHEIHSEEHEQPENNIIIVHQDIKPKNILLGKFGSPSSLAGVEEDLSAKIIDLGMARASGEDPERAWGTPGYWAPESILALSEGRNDFTAEGDIFAAGLMVMELAVGIPLASDIIEPVYDGWRLSNRKKSKYRSERLVGDRKNPFRFPFQKSMDRSVFGEREGILGSMDQGRQE